MHSSILRWGLGWGLWGRSRGAWGWDPIRRFNLQHLLYRGWGEDPIGGGLGGGGFNVPNGSATLRPPPSCTLFKGGGEGESLGQIALRDAMLGHNPAPRQTVIDRVSRLAMPWFSSHGTAPEYNPSLRWGRVTPPSGPKMYMSRRHPWQNSGVPPPIWYIKCAKSNLRLRSPPGPPRDPPSDPFGSLNVYPTDRH